MPLSTLWHDELINLYGNTGSEKEFQRKRVLELRRNGFLVILEAKELKE